MPAYAYSHSQPTKFGGTSTENLRAGAAQLLRPGTPASTGDGEIPTRSGQSQENRRGGFWSATWPDCRYSTIRANWWLPELYLFLPYLEGNGRTGGTRNETRVCTKAARVFTTST